MDEVCKNCGKPLILLDWNEDVYSIICDNVDCRSYHTPVGTIQKGTDFKVSKKSNLKIPDWMGGTNEHKDRSVEGRLQRLWREVYPEE